MKTDTSIVFLVMVFMVNTCFVEVYTLDVQGKYDSDYDSDSVWLHDSPFTRIMMHMQNLN